jgi:2-dehydro-3-deoxy-D-gluconate 5-dehydrogenase
VNVKNLFELKGKVAIITGGNGGIGFGMATGLVSAGATIVVAARNSQKSADAVKKLEVMGGSAVAIDVEVTDEASCKNLINQVAERFGRIDILANNAGINIRKQPQNYSLDEWKSVIDINLQSAFLLSKEVYPHMAKQRSGKIINTGSMTSIFGAPYSAAYGASKGGIVQLTQALACAWAKDNIQVNAILPGWIDTNLTIQARKDVPTLHDSVLARTPEGRWGRPEDLSGIAVFLASAASNFITGAAIPVDGGYSALA